MDHAPAPSWLDRHLDNRPGWADAPADGVEIDPSAVSTEPAPDEAAAPGSGSWLDDATIIALADDVDQIEVTEDDLAARSDLDDEFAIPAPFDAVSDTTAEPSLVDPFDEFVAETDAPSEELPDPTVDTDDADHTDLAGDPGMDVDDIAPAPDDTTATTATSGRDNNHDADEAGPADTGADPYDAFDSFDVADDAPAGDAVANGVGTTDPSWTSEPAGDDTTDTGYDAFDDLDEGTDG